MKVTTTEDAPKTFKPIEIHITIESADELASLTHQLSVRGSIVANNSNRAFVPCPLATAIDTHTNNLYCTVLRIAKEYFTL